MQQKLFRFEADQSVRVEELTDYFSIIGKKSPAHFAAYGVHKGKLGPNQNAGFDEILL